MTVIRLPFLLERVEPVAGGPLSTTELSYIDNVVNYAASKGIDVILDPHDFRTEYGTVIGTTAASNASFANFWGELAGHFASTPNVLFGLTMSPMRLPRRSGWHPRMRPSQRSAPLGQPSSKFWCPGLIGMALTRGCRQATRRLSAASSSIPRTISRLRCINTLTRTDRVHPAPLCPHRSELSGLPRLRSGQRPPATSCFSVNLASLPIPPA